MKITGILNKDKQYEDQPTGTTRHAQNIVISKDGRVYNEDGVIPDLTINYPYNAACVAEVDIDTIAIFPSQPTPVDIEAFVYTVGTSNPVKLKLPNTCTLSTFSYTVFRNYLKERIIVYTDKDKVLRTLNIDNPVVKHLNDNVDKLSRLTPDLDIIETTSVKRLKSGNLKTGRYFISYGLELEDNNPIKWTSPIGPYVVANYDDNEFLAHAGRVDAPSQFALELKFKPKSSSYRGINVGIISEINGVRSANIVHRCSAGEAWQEETFLYTGNEKVKEINPNEILINKLHVDKVQAVTQIQDSLIISGLNKLDHKQFEKLQLAANDIKVNFKASKVPKHYHDAANPDGSSGEYRYMNVDALEDAKNNPSLMPDEVYAFYLNVQLIDGTEHAYHIPGREPTNLRLDFIFNPGESMHDQTLDEDDPVPNSILKFRSDDGFRNMNPIGSCKIFQLFNTAEQMSIDHQFDNNTNDGYGMTPAYWCNESEYYPNDDRFGSLKGKQVKHHRVPSFRVCYNALTTMAFKINATFSNINIPDDLKPYISGIYFSAAKRTVNNSLISGFTPVIPQDPKGDGIFDDDDAETAENSSQGVRVYDYNMLANNIDPTFNYIKPIYYHEYNYGSNPINTLWNFRCKPIDNNNDELGFHMLKQELLTMTKVERKLYLPEGNAATEPPNIYEVGTDKIVNREKALYVGSAWDTRFDFVNTDYAHNLQKAIVELYNWNTELYTNFAKQEVFTLSQISPDVDMTELYTTGGDVFPGVEFKQIKYRPRGNGDPKDYMVTWLGFSPILQQARALDATAENSVLEKYNKSSTPVNDLPTVNIFGDNLDDEQFINNLPYRSYKSQVQATENDRLSIRNILVNSYTDCPQTKGEIINVIGRDDSLLVQTENTTWLYKVRDTLKTDEVNAYLGSTDIFTAKPEELILNKIGLGGNNILNSHLISRVGILYPDASNGEIFLVDSSVDYIARRGLSDDIKHYLSTANLFKSAYDEENDRLIISILGDKNVVLSYDPLKKGWVSRHTYDGCIPFTIGGKVKLLNVTSVNNDNKVYTFNSQAECYNVIDKTPAESYMDVVVHTAEQIPAAINSIYFKTICKSLVNYNNKYNNDIGVSKIMAYSRTKCTGLVDLAELKLDRLKQGSIISLKYGAWRFNDIYDMIMHYGDTHANPNDYNKIADVPYFIDELTGDYDPSTLSQDAGGSRASIPYYMKDQIVDNYIVVRFIIPTDIRSKISISDVALSLNQLS